MKLRTKFRWLTFASTVTGLLLLIGSLVFIGVFVSTGYSLSTLKQIGNNLTIEAAAQTIGIDDITASDWVIRLIDQAHAKEEQLHFEWYSSDGTLQYATDGRKASRTFDEWMERFVDMPDNLWGYDEEEATLAFEWEQNNKRQYLIMNIPSQAMQGTQFYFYARNLVLLLNLLIPLGLLFVTPIVFSSFFFSQISRRLSVLDQGMHEFDAESSRIRLDDRGKDEISQLYHLFNRMSERIRDQVAQIRDNEHKRQTLIANLSHDLRTPLTMIQGYAETLHTGIYQNEDERKTFTEIVLRRSLYMNGLLQKLLEVAQLDMQPELIDLQWNNLSETTRKLAADYIAILENHAMSFDIQIPEHSVMAKIDAHLIERAVRNLIENAIQYGKDGAYLGLELLEVGESIEIRVTDRGIGIPASKQDLIFDRFYRGSDAREGEGLGIGLSIVKDIMEAHHGKVLVESKPGEYTTFSLVFPMANTFSIHV
jgi:signal transduction histidine kinase